MSRAASRLRYRLRPRAARESRDSFMLVPLLRGPGTSESLTTVLVALGANLLIAAAKSVAAVLTGSASLVAEAAHSWADTGNEVFLLIANRRSRRPPDRAHPFGHGREAYVWSLFAALGLFVAGGAVSVTYGVQELIHPEPAEHFARRVHRAGRVLRPGGNLVPAVGPAGQIRGRVVAAGSDRARDGHLRSHAAGGVRRGLRRLDRPGHRGGRAGRPSADRFPGAGRGRVDPGRRAARRRRGRLDQPQPAVPGRRGSRPPGTLGGYPGPAGDAGGGPGDLPAAGSRRPADDLRHRRRRPHRR